MVKEQEDLQKSLKVSPKKLHVSPLQLLKESTQSLKQKPKIKNISVKLS